MSSPIEHARAVLDLRAQQAKLKAELDQLGKDLEVAEQRLTRSLIDNEMPFIPVGGYRLAPVSKTYVRARSDAKPQLLEELKARGFDALVKQDVNANSFAAFCREQIEDAGGATPGWLAPLVSEYTTTKVSVTKL